VVALLAIAATGCVRPLATARTSPDEPSSAEEIAAAEHVRGASCTTALGLLFPGLAQLCLGEHGKAALLGGLAGAEIATAIAVGTQVDDIEHPGVGLPLLAAQDLWLFGLVDASIQKSLAQRARYAPRDSLTDLVAAPFNGEVLKQPAVWAGTLGLLAVGVGVSWLVDDPDASQAGEDPDVFGHEVDRALGYPIGLGTGALLFGHVAIAEEVAFRGVLQSGLARGMGEGAGWVTASLLFGLAHAPNAWLLPEEERRDYLIYGLPVITVAGGYLGWLYRRTGYGLASPVAAHFWYDLALTMTFFVVDPKNSPLSASVALPF
jgi:membrane protease YdiL (CAAX protease family)